MSRRLVRRGEGRYVFIPLPSPLLSGLRVQFLLRRGEVLTTKLLPDLVEVISPLNQAALTLVLFYGVRGAREVVIVIPKPFNHVELLLCIVPLSSIVSSRTIVFTIMISGSTTLSTVCTVPHEAIATDTHRVAAHA